MTKNNFILITQKLQLQIYIFSSYQRYEKMKRNFLTRKKIKVDFKWDKTINFTLKWELIFIINVKNYPRRKFINHRSSR